MPGKLRLKAWRKRHGLTQAQAAERLGVAAAQLCRYETGKVIPGTAVAHLLQKECKIPMSSWVK